MSLATDTTKENALMGLIVGISINVQCQSAESLAMVLTFAGNAMIQIVDGRIDHRLTEAVIKNQHT